MIKSPLRYLGGKSRAIKLIAPLLPKFEEYREPFLGGGYSKSAFKGRFTESSIERLKSFGTILSNMKITNFDYKKLLGAGIGNMIKYKDYETKIQ